MNVYDTADIERLCGNKRCRDAELQAASFAPGALDCLQAYPYLLFINFMCSRFNESDFVSLGKLGKLKQLWFEKCELDGDWVRHLTGLEHLSRISFDRTTVGDEVLVHLGKMAFPNGDISMRHTRITDRGLAHLVNLADLRCIAIADTAISDEGILQLAVLPKLKFYASGPKVTEAGTQAFLKRQRELKKRAKPSKPVAPGLVSTADEPDVAECKALLMSFFEASNLWEIRANELANRDTSAARWKKMTGEMLVKLRTIFAAHCTDKPRLGFRPDIFTCGSPLEYEKPEQCVFVDIERPSRNRMELYTNEWNMFRQRFVLLKKGGKWRIDGRYAWMPGGWERYGL